MQKVIKQDKKKFARRRKEDDMKRVQEGYNSNEHDIQ